MTKTIIPITPEEKLKTDPALGDGLGCHSGEAEMLAAAKAAGNEELLPFFERIKSLGCVPVVMLLIIF
jgi:hypothetical protein